MNERHPSATLRHEIFFLSFPKVSSFPQCDIINRYSWRTRRVLAKRVLLDTPIGFLNTKLRLKHGQAIDNHWRKKKVTIVITLLWRKILDRFTTSMWLKVLGSNWPQWLPQCHRETLESQTSWKDEHLLLKWLFWRPLARALHFCPTHFVMIFSFFPYVVEVCIVGYKE